MKITILNLSSVPGLYEKCAHWAYIQWHKSNNTEYALVKADYKLRAQLGSLPLCYLAMDEGKPIGMVSLKKYDLNRRRDLSPWLSALYVEPEYRKMGIGRVLVNTVIDKARLKKFKSLYLFVDRHNTDSLCKYYQKLGWMYFDSARDVMSCEVKILKFQLTI